MLRACEEPRRAFGLYIICIIYILRSNIYIKYHIYLQPNKKPSAQKTAKDHIALILNDFEEKYTFIYGSSLRRSRPETKQQYDNSITIKTKQWPKFKVYHFLSRVGWQGGWSEHGNADWPLGVVFLFRTRVTGGVRVLLIKLVVHRG